MNLKQQVVQDLKQQLEDIKVRIDAFEKPKGYFKPKPDQMYYYVSDDFNIGYSYGGDNPINRFRISQGNCFETMEEAEIYAKYLQALGRVRMYILDNHYFEPDYRNHLCETFFLNADNIGHISYNDEFDFCCKLPPLPSREACDDVMEKCKDDLKIIFNLK